MKKKFLLLLLVTFSTVASAQDTLRFMTWNILNYQYPDSRHADIRTVIQYYKPDVVVMQEIIDANATFLLLDTAFNAWPINYYQKAVFVNGPDTDNMFYYDGSKVTLLSQNQISTSLRDISRYRIRSISASDTVFISFFSLHLKAGNTAPDENDRLMEANDLCNYLGSVSTTENILVAGDMNVYTSFEPAYVCLTTTQCAQRLYDPINQPGNWSSNFTFANIHTQSTRSVTNPGCCGGANGGLDDRFDQILVNYSLYSGVERAKILPATQFVPGNDGNHYNLAIIEAPTNTSAPTNVINALFNVSDHLPVIADIVIHKDFTGVQQTISQLSRKLSWISSGQSQVVFTSDKVFEQVPNIKVVDITGRSIPVNAEINNDQHILLNHSFTPGTYILVLEENNTRITCRFLVW